MNAPPPPRKPEAAPAAAALLPEPFAACIAFTLAEECGHDPRNPTGYVNNPRDPGGETRFGISKRAHPDVDIRKLTRARAVAIYQDEYWAAQRFGQLPMPLAAVAFDSAVNCGAARAVRWLQQACGTDADGFIGPATLAMAQANPTERAAALLKRRMKYYRAIPGWRDFGRGWTTRVQNLARTFDIPFDAMKEAGK